ncbi:filamentous hemagglutinin N-terminal domain-containing protein [Dyella choica]|uniref:Filamentous hemagglutinin N-terminal domain-containing protein n=1 Tax=Dyella choica TaxID=1927959 RepID=A0A432M827_9GAMM|nr:filamentous hemagglutinin N-terminal domain-containing protein [Dyella choica]RUL77694.1 filamentous hemagglutinin N-terminal domain-containing protein [Dyella choica]
MSNSIRKQQHTSSHSNGLPVLRRKLLPASLVSLLGLFACGGEAWAGGHVAANATPTGGSIVGGSGSIAQNGANTTVVQNSQLLALNWQTFNVGSNASVIFKQPSFTSVALNRILDQNASQIFGHVNANGQVFLINTHGIIFGRSAQMNVGGLVASTLDLTPSDFLANHFNLDARGGSAGIVNHGTIEAASGGSVNLIGGQVSNDGLIVANYGHINLDGADRAVLDFDGDGLINVQVTGDLQKRLNADEAAVTNKGTLKADGGTVVLQASAAKDLFTDLVNNTGVISAGGISTRGGKVQLIASGGNAVTSGTIDVSGAEGGSVQVLSDQNVGVTGNIDASGTQGGGSIRVGGGYQGGEGLQTANATYVAPTAALKADATQTGNGGSVVVWGNQVNNFYGSISAHGGALGGNGGLVETSSHYGLNAQGSVDASAVRGKAGTWLLDPYDVTINSGSTTSNITTSGSSTYTASGNSSVIGNSVINNALTGGTNVFVFTGSSGTQNGDINVSAPITASGAGVLYLEAAGSILDNSNISSNGVFGLSVAMWADYAGPAAGTTYSRGSSCASSTACVVQLNGASISTNGGSVEIETNGAVNLTAGSSITTTGGVVLIGNSTANAVNNLSIDSTSGIDTTRGFSSGNLSVIASSGINALGALTIAGTTSLSAGAGAISATNAGNNFIGAIALSNSGNNNVALSNNVNALQLGNVAVGTGTLTVSGTGITQATGTSITQAVGAGGASFDAGAGALVLANAGNDFIGPVTLSNTGSNDVTLSNGSNALLLGNVNVGAGALQVSGTGIAQAVGTSITQAAGAGTATFSAGAASITLANTSNDITGSVGLNNSGANNVSVNNGANLLTLDNVSVGTGTLALSGTGLAQANSTAIGQTTGAGAVTLNGGAGAITLNNSSNNFVGTVGISNTGANDVILSNGGNPLILGSVSVGGAFTAISSNAIHLTQNINSSGTQIYQGPVTLDADATLTDTSGSGVSFQNTVNGGHNLTVSTTGTTQFGQSVGASANLASLTVGTGGITLNGNVHSITTTGSQTYNSLVALGHATTLQGSMVNLNAGVSGGSGRSLTVTGNASLAGTSSALTSLSVSGTTQLAGAVTSSGTQTYTGAVTLSGNSTLNSTGSGGAITFGSTVDGNYNLGVTSSSSSISFNGTVGGLTELASLTAHGNSGVTLSSNIATTGTQIYTGALTLSNASTTLVGSTVTVNNAINQSTRNLTISGNAVLSSTGTEHLSALNVTGTSLLDGNVSAGTVQSYAGLVTLGSSVTSLAGPSITLNGGVTGGSASGITLNGNATLGGSSSLSSLTVTGNTLLQGNVTTSGAQTYTGAVTLGTNATLDSTGGDINFSSTVDNNTTTAELLITDAPGGAVNFGAAVGSNATNGALGGLTTQSSTFSDTGTLKIGASGLSITTTGGSITQGGAFTVAGSSVFNAGGNAISLTSSNAFTGTVSLANSGANDVSLTNGGLLTLSNVDVGSGALTLIGAGIAQSGGHIAQASGAGTASFNAGSNALTLNSATNSFTGAVDLIGANTQITSGSALNLGASTISGTLAVSNSGAVSQSGALTVTGAASFTQTNTIAGSGQDIVLNNAGNDFKSTVTFAASGGGAQIHDLSLTNSDATPGALTLPASNTGNLTLNYTAAVLALPAAQVGGNLTATSNAGITQSGALSVTGTSAFNAGSSAITLNNAGNSFAGAVDFTGGNTQIASGSALNLGTSTISGTLAVSNTGSITQSGALTVSGAASFTQNGTGNDVLLNAGNDFQNAVTIAGTGVNNLTLTNTDLASNAPTLPASVAGNLTLNYAATSGLTLPATAVGGTLDVTAANGIHINGNETTGGGQTYHSAVTLTTNATLQSTHSGAIDFVSNVTGAGNTLTLLTGGAATVGGATQLGGLTSTSSTFSGNALTIGSGGLSITTTGGAITQTGAFSVAGASTFNAGSQNITLTDPGNSFAGAVSLTGGTTAISQNAALTLGSLNTQALTVTSQGALNLGSGTVNGGLTANSGGAITQSGALTVAGSSAVNAGSNNITLASANHFGGVVALTGGITQIANGATQLTLGTLNTGALIATSGASLNLGAGTVNGALTATGSGLIAQNGALTVNGAASITQNGSGQDVLLANTGNQFKSTVDFAGAQISNLSFANAFATSSSGLTLPASISGNLTLVYPNAGLGLPGTSVGGALSITANNIIISGNETTGGGQTYNGAVTLGNDVTLHSTGNGDIDFASGVNGAHALALNTGGNVTLGGAANLNGLTSTSNTFSGNALTIGSGGLSITTTGGAITQTGAFTVTGSSAFNAGNSAITLTNAGNNFAGAVALTGGTTQISQSSALALGAVHTGSLTVNSQGDLNLGSGSVSGDLAATSGGGTISESGALSVSGNSALNSGAGAITLSNAGNTFGGAVNLTGGATQITDSAALSLGTLNTGDLTVNSNGSLNLGSGAVGGNLAAASNGGAISQTGALSVAGTTTLNGGNGSVSLTDAGNVFTGAVTATGAGVSLNDAGDLAVASLTDNASGGVSLTATGTLSAYGISAGSGNISLASNGGTLSTGGTISGGNISLTGLKGISSTNTINASGTLTLNSSQGGITSAGGITAGNLTGSSGGATALNGSNAIGTLGSFSANGFSLSNGQSLTVSGPVNGNNSLALAVSGGDLTLNGSVSGTNTALNAAGTISEGSGGSVTAGTLAGSAGGAVTLNGVNQVSTLGNFSAASFSLVDRQALTVSGAINGGANASLTTNGGDLTIKGSISGTNTVLHSAGGISESGGITAGTLSGSAAGAATLTGNNQVGTLGNFSASGFSLKDGQSLTVNGSVNGGGNSTLATTTGDITLNGAVTGDTVALYSAGAISEGGDGVNAGTLTGSSAGATSLNGYNQVSTLGSFTANGFSLTDARALTVVGPLNGGSSLALTTTGGSLAIDGEASGSATSLNSAGALSEGGSGSIIADTLSGNVGGGTTLTGLNKVNTLGDFRSLAGFSFANDQTLVLGSVKGSDFVVNAGTSPVSIAVTHGNLYQSDHSWTYDGTGSWSATGAIGTQSNPIYVLGTTTQYITLIGTPPGYFYAVSPIGTILPIVGDSVNIPTSLFSSRAQNVNNHLDSYIDASVISANYRSFGIVPTGILLPQDQRGCQAGGGGTDCADE